MNRENHYDIATGHRQLILRGPGGVVHAELWLYQGHLVGVIGIHSPRPVFPGQQPENCCFLGHCYADTGCRGGQEAADLYDRGDIEAAWHEVEQWYASRFTLEATA